MPLSFSLPFLGVSRKRKIAFFQQLEYLFDAGVPPIRSLRALAEKGGTGKLKRVALDMAAHIEQGGSLASAFARHPALFSPLELKMISAAEQSGAIAPALSSIIRAQSETGRLWARFWIDMIYPGILLFTALVFCPLLKSFFLGGMENLTMEITRNAVIGLVSILSLIILYRFLNSNPISRPVIQGIFWRMPLFGKVIRHYCKARFSKIFENLYLAGLPIRETYKEAALACGNGRMTHRLLKYLPILEEGGTLFQALSSSRLFDPVALGLIATGEESGKLDLMLSKYAQYEEQEARQKIQILARTLPMLIYFAVAGYVVYIVMNGYTQYFKMLDQI